MCSAKSVKQAGQIPGSIIRGGGRPGATEGTVSQEDIKKAQEAQPIKAPPPEPLSPGEAKEATQAARTEEEKRARLRAGRRSTILTSPFGVQAPAFIRRRTLLGE